MRVRTISEDSVFLRNPEFPLFGQGHSAEADLEEKLKENACKRPFESGRYREAECSNTARRKARQHKVLYRIFGTPRLL